MADTRGRQAIKITDPTTNANEARVTAAGNVGVDIGASITLTVDTELTAVAALADGLANPTISNISALSSIYNGTTWDRQRSVITAQDTTGTGIAAAGILGQLDDASTNAVTENQFAPVRISTRRALLVEGVASGTSITVDTELTAVAALADAVANPTITNIAALGYAFNGTTWDRVRGAATLADALANPGIGLVQGQSFLMGYNGSTWDRVRTANTGRLQVDVITGGGSDTPTNPVISYQTSASLAAGSSVALNTAEAASKKLQAVYVWCSTPFKATITTVDNGSESTVKGIGGGQAAVPFYFKPPHRNYVATGTTAGADNFRCNVTNLDSNTAADVYAVFYYED